MTTLFPIPPTYELPVWPASNDSYDDLWSLLSSEEYPNQLPLLTDIEFPDDNDDLRGLMDPMLPFPTHRVVTPEPVGSFYRIHTPEPGSINRMSTPDPSPFNSIPTPEPSPLPKITTPDSSSLQSIPIPDSSSLQSIPTPDPSPVRITSTARPGSLYIKPTPKPSPLPRMSTPEPSPMDSVLTPESSPLPNKPIPEALRSSPAPSSTLHSTPSHLCQMHNTPTAVFGPPLQSMSAHSQVTEVRLKAGQVKNNLSGRIGRLVLNSENDKVPMDCANNEAPFPKNVKQEEEQQDSKGWSNSFFDKSFVRQHLLPYGAITDSYATLSKVSS